MEFLQCVSINLKEMGDFETFADNERTCHTTNDTIEMLKNNPKRTVLKKTCMKQRNNNKRA